MQSTQMKYTAEDLLHTASGGELLMLMAMSNTSMREQIRRELDDRAARAHAALRLIRKQAA